jgi:hypothetical protein
MNFFAPPKPLALYSNLSADECARRISQAIDVEKIAPFSFSGYRGSKAFLGEITGSQFRILRRGYRNAFPPVLSGVFLPQKRGTRVDGSFDLELTSKIALCLLSLVVSLPIMTLVVPYSLREHTVPAWVAVSFASVWFVGALLVPRIVRRNGRDQERDIADFLCAKLEAGEDSSAFESGRKS